MTIWKYDLSVGDTVRCEMPRGAKLLHIGNQTGAIGGFTVWALVDPSAPLVKRDLIVVGTGHPVFGGEYVGTTVNGPLVWHIFDGGEIA